MTDENQMQVEESVEDNASPQGQAPTPDTTELTVSDLANIRQIIDIATSRGAFKANEMTQIGPVYDKLDKFLNHIAAQQQAASATAPSE